LSSMGEVEGSGDTINSSSTDTLGAEGDGGCNCNAGGDGGGVANRNSSLPAGGNSGNVGGE
jgi:hypothetical protein